MNEKEAGYGHSDSEPTRHCLDADGTWINIQVVYAAKIYTGYILTLSYSFAICKRYEKIIMIFHLAAIHVNIHWPLLSSDVILCILIN